MKEVKCLWLGEKESYVEAETLNQLLNKHRYIGFIPKLHCHEQRYMLVTSGSCKGCPVSPEATWTNATDQVTSRGKYFVFDSAKELYTWLLEGEE